jgi:hypothetical protein
MPTDEPQEMCQRRAREAVSARWMVKSERTRPTSWLRNCAGAARLSGVHPLQRSLAVVPCNCSQTPRRFNFGTPARRRRSPASFPPLTWEGHAGSAAAPPPCSARGRGGEGGRQVMVEVGGTACAVKAMPDAVPRMRLGGGCGQRDGCSAVARGPRRRRQSPVGKR